MARATSSSPSVSAKSSRRTDVAERARRLYVDDPKTAANGSPLRVISCHLGAFEHFSGNPDGVVYWEQAWG